MYQNFIPASSPDSSFQLIYLLIDDTTVFTSWKTNSTSWVPVFPFSCCPSSHALGAAISTFSFYISSLLLTLWYRTLISALASTQAVLIGIRSNLWCPNPLGLWTHHTSWHGGHLCSLLCPEHCVVLLGGKVFLFPCPLCSSTSLLGLFSFTWHWEQESSVLRPPLTQACSGVWVLKTRLSQVWLCLARDRSRACKH